jgi:hypothetical protein
LGFFAVLRGKNTIFYNKIPDRRDPKIENRTKIFETLEIPMFIRGAAQKRFKIFFLFRDTTKAIDQ